ncbi:MAG: FlgO family outer membrane protein [Bacteroidota bacterium]|nr:FlgO family outer membrane protein [Bacteroidota bacterium]MDP4228876.1 FlgO family outer membrane protein [Bacteroidota bacterium]MDP4234959.1 FlgO family outer membrane protein [Bacteroidota bacterium]
MADIFISYSTHDREKASKLSERLRERGYSVWLDETNISAATQWSSEIVRAIESCKVFLILLSPYSFGSHNVIKELSLASEEKKKIIPIELEPVELTHEVKYQLAGIQRVPYKDFERIDEAVKRFIGESTTIAETPLPAARKSSIWPKIGIGMLVLGLIAAGYFFFAPKPESSVKAKATPIKKIVVLPFESLSSDKEDEYFADGLTAQVITTLSGLGGLQVIDRKTAMQYKGRKSDLHAIAKELGIEYVVDGTVQKQGKNIKITSQLINAESGKVLRSDQYDGTVDDVFAVEEKLARSIAFELQGSLVQQRILDSNAAHQSTKNAEAYNKFLIGIGYLDNIRSEAQLMKGMGYIEEAVKLDPKFAYAQYFRSLGYLLRFQALGDTLRDLEVSDSLARLSIRIDPSLAEGHFVLATIARVRGQLDTAIKEAKLFAEMKPENAENISALSFLGNIYYERGEFDLAATYLEHAVQNNITDLSAWSILIDCYQALGDTAKRNRYIDESIPLYELYLEKNPAVSGVRVQFALNLANRDLKEEAHRQIALILKATDVPPVIYYNIACTYSRLKEIKPALEMLKKSFEKGYNPGEAVNKDPDFANIRDLPEFKEIAKRMMASKRTPLGLN